MGIIARFKDIMSANINALLDKCEDPAKMIDEYMRQVTEQLAEVKKETAGVMAEEKRTKRLLDENDEQIAKYDGLARKALAAGNENDARVFLEKKQEFTAAGVGLKKTYDIAHENAVKMREMHDKLTDDIVTLDKRRKEVKSKMAVAKTQEKINEINQSIDKASGAMSAFERMEAKADKLLDESNSMAELNENVEDSVTDLESKYDEVVNSSNVEDELAKLKKEMGMQ